MKGDLVAPAKVIVGLVSVLKQIHDELDAAVFDAYGWTASLAAQVKAVRQALADAATDQGAEELAARFEGARKDVRARKIAEILETLAALGRARETSDGRFVA